MSARAVPVLMYHHVTPNPGLVTVRPEIFRAQMAWLAERGYRSISCAELAGFLAGAALPEKSVLITFDDGYLDNYVHAHPVLREYGLHAALFLVTGWLGDGPVRPHAGSAGADGGLPQCPNHREATALIRGGNADLAMLRWSEVAAMAAAGTFEFHSHTHRHIRWDREIADPEARRAALADDLAESRATLAARIGASDHLCWPQGYHDADYRRVAAASGFRYLYTVEKGINVPATPAERIARTVIKDKAGAWFASRVFLYRQPRLGGFYLRWRGE